MRTPHWGKLRHHWVYQRKDIGCWITGKKYPCLLHHEDYAHLYHERFNRDVFKVVFHVHDQLHFWRILGIKVKVPLTRASLMRRRMFVKARFCVGQGKIVQALYYFLLFMLI